MYEICETEAAGKSAVLDVFIALVSVHLTQKNTQPSPCTAQPLYSQGALCLCEGSVELEPLKKILKDPLKEFGFVLDKVLSSLCSPR